MEKGVETIKNIIENSQSAALLLEQKAGEEFFLAKEALRTALLLKNLALISLPENPPDYAQKWSSLLASNSAPVPQKVSIRIPKDKYPVKELKYDENDDFFSLLITTQGPGFNKEALIFEQALPKVDSAFCFSAHPDPETLEDFKKIELPEKEKITVISPGEKTVSQKVFDIVSSLNIEPEILKTSHLTSLLLAGVIKETDNLTRNTSQEVLRQTAFLLEQGADKNLVQEIFNQEKSPAFWQLLGRSLARTAVDKNLKSSWTFLTKKDFEKSRTEPKPELLLQILNELNKSIASQTFSVLVWQNPKNSPEQTKQEEIRAIMSSADQNKLGFLANNLNAQLENSHLRLGPFKTFSEAEIQLRQALKSALL